MHLSGLSWRNYSTALDNSGSPFLSRATACQLGPEIFQFAFRDDLKNFIKGVFCVLKKVVFVTAIPKGKKYYIGKKRQYKYTNYLQYTDYLHFKFNKVEAKEIKLNGLTAGINNVKLVGFEETTSKRFIKVD